MADAKVDAMLDRLRQLFEVKSGYKDTAAQAQLLERHFKCFDTDGSGVIDFDEFSRAMVKLNFVGVQAEMEALFDRFDEDLNGVLSYAEVARGAFGCGGKPLLSDKAKSTVERVKDKLLEAGGKNGIRTLGVILRRMDLNGNGTLEPEVRTYPPKGRRGIPPPLQLIGLFRLTRNCTTRSCSLAFPRSTTTNSFGSFGISTATTAVGSPSTNSCAACGYVYTVLL